MLRAGVGAAVGAAMTGVPMPAWALPAPKRLLLVVAYGGWDSTYALDPKPGAPLLSVPPGVERRFGDINIWSHAERPKVDAFFSKYASISSVLRGVQVRSFVHADCIKRVLTGTPSDARPDLGAMCAFELGKDLPVPYLVLGSSAISGTLASITGRAGTTNQILSLVSEPAAYPDPGSTTPTLGFVPRGNVEASIRAYHDANVSRLRATRGMRGGNAREIQSFVSALDRAGLLREFASKPGSFGSRSYTPDLNVQVEVAVRALEGSLSQTVMLEMDGWDTHANNSLQSGLFDTFFGALTKLADDLAAKNLLDSTLVVVLSEMGRTPKLNPANGKDHWPVTSALLFGGGLAGNRVIGGTSDRLDALPIDYATGLPSATGKQLQTPSLLASVMRAAGASPEAYFPNVEAIRAISG